MFAVSHNFSSVWWQSASCPPPAAWAYAFELFTGDDTAEEWALAAAIFVAQYRRRHSCGPTFRELFLHLLPDECGVPAPLPLAWDEADRRRALDGFRRHVTIDWRRRGYIGFDRHVTRSLRVGPEFRQRSKFLRQARVADATRQGDLGASSPLQPGICEEYGLSHDVARPALQAPLNAGQVMARLNIGSAMLQRLRKSGYLLGFEADGGVFYPIWQFSDVPGRPVIPGISAVVAAMPPSWTLASSYAFMSARQGALEMHGDKLAPVQWLVRGGDPERVASLLADPASEMIGSRRPFRAEHATSVHYKSGRFGVEQADHAGEQ